MERTPKLKRVVIANYKSIESCEVHLGPLTLLVGLNGAGKSNFVDALRFCRDALRGTLEQAFSERRSNLRTLTHFSRSEGFSMRFDLDLGSGQDAHYTFSIGPQSPRGFQVQAEECWVGDSYSDRFFIRSGKLSFPEESLSPAVSEDRLYLVQASGKPHFRPVYNFLANLEFYNPEPAVMKLNFDTPGPGDVLESDGVNTANILDRIKSERPEVSARIIEYMQRILPGLENIEVGDLRQTYKFLQFEFDQGNRHKFFAEAMSDGTLRALAILIALFQKDPADIRPSLVCIEEPETGLHPSASGILLAALTEASSEVQVVITSHSSDLLDNSDVEVESLRAVESVAGATRIGPVDDATKQALQMKLYSTGELIRMNQVSPQTDHATARPAGELMFDHTL